jgi:hypothetical protein
VAAKTNSLTNQLASQFAEAQRCSALQKKPGSAACTGKSRDKNIYLRTCQPALNANLVIDYNNPGDRMIVHPSTKEA